MSSSPLHVSSAGLSTKDPKSTILISLITVAGERCVVRIEAKHLPRYDTKDVDALDIPAELLKEILWSRWQKDWGSQPSDPSRIKLVHFGRTIDNFTPLKFNLKFRAAIVVHMAIESLTTPDHAGFQGDA
ncbi:hypothetical protein B0O99DRAFT_646231 [Bisporella sp. PMI_857]|nr:hypothetical protein B0O99DRAFT_646231 [Bisporella sp. PMI_857]